ncbi:MAG: endonuclease/exonuclease/phosphatase family protein [Nocardioidaceae bacterium]
MKVAPGRLWMALTALLLSTATVGGFVVLDSPGRALPVEQTLLRPVARPAVQLQPTRRETVIVSRYQVRRPVTLKAKPRLRHVSADFVISTFNALGASHTAHHGSHARYAGGRSRARRAAEIVLSHDVSVVGFQELQAPQYNTFMAATGHRYSAYPGLSLGALNTENSLVWRTADWTMLKAFPMSIPYFGGHHRLMPAVLLQNRATGLKAWFLNVHNPADTGAHKHQLRFRMAAMAKEAATVDSLAATDGVPVFLTGDFNEREIAYCRFTRIGMVSASGGGGGCSPPHPTDIDWIFAKGGVTFSSYDQDGSRVVRRTTDHYVIFGTAHLAGTRRTAP